MRDALEKLNIIVEQPCRCKNSEFSKLSTFTPQILTGIEHIKDISHKGPDVDTIFGYIKKATASNIDKETIKDFIMQLLEQIIVNKVSQSGKDSYMCASIIYDLSIPNNHQSFS